VSYQNLPGNVTRGFNGEPYCRTQEAPTPLLGHLTVPPFAHEEVRSCIGGANLHRFILQTSSMTREATNATHSTEVLAPRALRKTG
jgi:hypothetical protein